MLLLRPIPVQRLAAFIVAVVALMLLSRPGAAFAATTVSTSANAVRVSVTLLGAPVTVTSPATANWSSGQPTATNQLLNVDVPSVLTTGAVLTNAAAASDGGKAEGKVAGLSLLGSTLGAATVGATCQMTSTGITGSGTTTNLRLLGAPANVQADGTISLPGVLTAKINSQTAGYNASTGLLTYTVRGIDLSLLSATSAVVSGNVVIAEAICKGTVKLGTITTTSAALVPGQSGTPKVTVSNTGDTAAPNTTVRIPKPDATYYTLGTPTVAGGVGSCDATGNANFVVCTGVTVPGGGTATINLPVTLNSSATGSAPAWSPSASTITASSTPVPADTSTSISINGGGTALATALPRSTTGGTITVNPTSLTAGKTKAATITVANAGPSDATGATVTVPIGNIPAGVRITSVTSSSGTCSADASNVTCSNVNIAAGASATITLNTAATTTTAPGTTWDLANVSTTLNGKAVSGYGRLLTVTDPDVNFDNGVSITPAAATPGGSKVNATVKINNVGALASPTTTVTFPAAPSGYTLDAADASAGGGTCAVTAGVLACTNVAVPAMTTGTPGSVTVTVPVTLSSGTTANWTGAATAASADGSSSGTATGTLVSAVPRYNLSVAATGPAARTVSPGQSTTVTVNVSNQGPSNAVNAPFVVVAPPNTTFGPLSGAVASACQTLTPATLRCTVNEAPTDPAIALTLPLQISGSADVSTPITGGCVSLDNDSTCGGTIDSALSDIVLRSPLATRLSVNATPATITPGSSGTGRLTLTSSQAESGMQVTVGKSALPSGFTVTGATVSGGSCDATGSSIVCTGVDLAASTPKDVQVTVAVAPTAAASQTWTATGLTVQAGNEQITTNGALATTGVPSYTLTAAVSAPAAGTVPPGGTANVPLTVTNTGPSAASPATFSVTAPNGTTIGALDTNTANVCQVNAGNTVLTCSTGLAVNATTPQLTVPLVVAPNADPSKTISGSCVELDSYPGCGTGDVPLPPITLKIPASAQVGFASTPVTVTPGSTSTAKVTVSATRATLSGTSVTVPVGSLPAGLSVTGVTLASGGTTCPISGGLATCTIPTITTSVPQDVDVALSATAAATTGTWTAQGITATIPAGTVTAPDQTLATIGPPRNVVTATVNPPVSPILPGGTGTVSVSVDNTGPSDATGASFTVIAPNGATFTAPTAGSTTAASCAVAPDGVSATCTFDQTATAPPTVFPFNVQISSNVQPGTDLTGGCVDVDNNGFCTLADTTMSAIQIATPLQAQLTVTTAPATVVPGAVATSTAKIILSAPADVSGLKVVNSVAAPPGLAVVGVTDPDGNTCTVAGDGTFTCTSVNLTGSNHSGDITVSMRATAAAGPAAWAGSYAVTGADGQTAAGTGRIARIAAAQTALTDTTSGPADGTVNPGGTADVTVTVANAGPSDATNQAVILTAPSGTTFGSPPAGCETSTSTRLLCRVTVLANGSAGVTVPVVVPAGADVFTTISGGCVDNGGVGTCVATMPDIVLRQPVDRRATVSVTPVTVTPGATGNATVNVAATNGALTNFTITVPVTAQTSAIQLGSVTPSGPCTASTGTTVSCTWASIAKGNSQSVTLPFSADASAAAGITATTPAIAITDAVGSASLAGRQLAVTGAASSTITPTFGSISAVEPGSTGTIPVTLTNAGPSDSGPATVTVVAPTGTTFGASLPGGCTADTSGTTLTCSVNLASGATASLAVPVAVPASADPSDTVSGGCIDINNSGTCTVPPDTTLPTINLTSRLDQEVTVRADRAALDPGADTKQAKLIITSTKAQNVDVTIPLTGLPTGWTVTAASPAGCLINGTTSVTCSGLALATAAGGTAITLDVTTPAGAAMGDSWLATNVTVAGHTNQTVTSSNLMALVGAVPYTLAASVSGVPAGNTVLPGDTVPLTVTIRNTGAASSLKAPVQITAPAGTTFGTTMPPGGDCVRNTATTVNCSVAVATTGQVAAYTLPIVIPGNAAGGTVIQGGCVDLDVTGSCDVTVDPFTLRSPIASVVSVASTTPATPVAGQTGTATVNLTAAAVRPGLGISVNLGDVPTGVSVSAVRLGGQTCTIAGGTATCPSTDFAAGGTTPLAIDLAAGSATAAGATWRPSITVADGSRNSVVLRPLALTVGTAPAQVSVALGLPAAGSVLPGGTADTEVTMTNTSTADNPNATATFTAPAGTTFDLTGTTAASYCTATTATQVTCSTALAAGAKTQFRMNLRVASTVAAGTTLAGGCVDAPGGSTCDTAFGLALGKAFADQATLSFTRATVVPGAVGTAYVRVTTDRALSGLTVTVPLDKLPSGVDIAGASGPVGSSCTVNSADIVCSGVALSQGAAQDLVAVRIHPGSDQAANVYWAPVVDLTNGSGGLSEGSGVLLQTLAPAPDVKYTMSVPSTPVAPGDTATITGTLDNVGYSDLTGVSVRVKAPTGTTFGSPLPAGCTAVGNALMDCTLNLPAGAAAPVSWALPIQIPANADPSQPVTGGCVDFDRDNVCETGERALPAIQLAATLAQALTIGTPGNGGSTLTPGATGTVTVAVASTQARTNMTVSIPIDTLPSGMQIVQARTDNGSCSVGQRAVTCTGVSVAAGGAADIVLTSLVSGTAPTGTWSPNVTVSQGTQSKEQTVTGVATIGAPQVDVKITVGVPGSQTVLPGGSSTLTLTATNNGPSQASGRTYTVVAPAGTSFPPLTGAAAGTCTRVSPTVVTCQMTVAGNGRSQVTLPIAVDATASPATPITGGCVKATAGTTCAAGDTTIPSITLATPLSGKVQFTGAPVTVVPGRTGSGVVKLTATGAVTGATVTIPLAGKPDSITMTGASGPTGSTCAITATEIKCTGVSLTTGVNNAVTVTTSVAPGAAGGVTWRSTGITVAAGTETATGLADLITTGTPVAAVTFKPANASTTVKPGDTTAFSVAITNAGPSNVTNRTATLIAPNNTTFGTLTGTAAQDCTVTSPTVLTCTYSLEASATKSWMLPLAVSAGVKNGDKLTGGCISADGNKTCGSDLDVAIDSVPVNNSISKTGTLTLDSTVIATGASGSAVVRLSATAAFTGLTLTVPLGALPTGFTVKSAAVEGGTCTVGDTAVRCTGVSLIAGQPKVLSLGVDVASSAAATAAWWATGITLARTDDATDKLTASGLLVSTSKTEYAVGVTVGTPSNTAPLPGQTTTLPITLANAGPGDASPYVATILLPPGMSAGSLPSGCVVGSTARTVVCTVTLPAGSSKTVQLPLVVSSDLQGGETLTGGCVDEVLSTDPESDGACDGDADVAIPGITLSRFKVNLALTYDKPAVTVGPSTTALVVKIPYTNQGTDTANDVKFTVVPPAGVLIRGASILLDTTVAEDVVAVAAAARTVMATCEAAGGDAPSNAVVCSAPNADGLYDSELWLTVDGSNAKKSGTQAMKVAISTAREDGKTEDNTVSVLMKLTAKAAGGNGGDSSDGNNDDGGSGSDGGGDLPRTGPQVLGALVTSMMLVIAGALMLLPVRRPGAVTGAGRVPAHYPPRHVRPAARPWARRRRDDRQLG